MRTLLPFFVCLTLLSGCDRETAPLVGTPASAQAITTGTEVAIDNSAHWISPGVIILKKHPKVAQAGFYYSLDSQIVIDGNSIDLGKSATFALREIAFNSDIAKNYPQFLTDYAVFKPEIDISEATIKVLLKGQLVAVQRDADNRIVHAAQVQPAKLIDHIFTSGADDADEVDDLGASITGEGVQFKLWAPTARKISVLLFDKDKQPLSPSALPMSLDERTGVWRALGDAQLNHAFYRYQVEVYHPATQKLETLVTTDPYSLSLSTNSLYSQVIDLSAAETKPAGWDEQTVLELAHVEDAILYEMHIRDFSASERALADEAHRGKYKAFSETDSYGVKHLKDLRAAGLTHIHLLPTFDISTVNEDPTQAIYPQDTLAKVCRIVSDASVCQGDYNAQQTVQGLLASYDPRGSDAQALIEQLRANDAYNWGYDPFHYTVPEGSYATSPDGLSRIVEFREMVQSLHNMGFRVVMDAVYNHTFQARLHPQSVLDKIVPNYYNRLSLDVGAVEDSTCCSNTATEHRMMAKLMSDSLVIWARDYKIDGFRFDLMGHQPKAVMLAARDAVRAVDPDTYFYGEGWNFGEVQDNRLFVQATQIEMGGTEIGTYSDRMRDSVRGGRPFDEGNNMRHNQGLANGLYTLPNELQADDRQLAQYQVSMDQARIGLAGNLANFPLVDSHGKNVTGKYVPYYGGNTGYALDPADTINYVCKHDNQTLWDNNQYRIAYQVSSDDRVRMQNLALAYPLFAQGIPFIQMGAELLRSKSFLRDSFDFSDWFNAVDFSMRGNNYDVGLPPAEKDRVNWALISELLRKNEGRDHVSPEQIRFASQVFMEALRIRSGSPLFRLTTEQDVIARVRFHNTGAHQQAGIIAMSIDDSDQEVDLDPNYEGLFVVFNNSGETQTFAHAGAAAYRLHPVQAGGVDRQLASGAKASKAGFTVPALSAAVFVK